MGDSLIDLLDAITDIAALCEKIIRHEQEVYRDEHRELRDKIAQAYLGKYQAIQIPKDHGRLIDAKLLADTINKAIQDGTFTSKSIWEWIGDAPTIIEAEE